jgi:Tfp pilus assembly protein PilF
MTRRLAVLALPVITSVLLAACVQPPTAPPVGLLDVAERPAEKALMAGMRAYDDAQYPQAEKQLQAALQAGLVSPRDRAAAHKLLAFIFCTSNRAVDCEVQFRSARAADPAFALSKSEAGHPLWGPVYQRVLQR